MPGPTGMAQRPPTYVRSDCTAPFRTVSDTRTGPGSQSYSTSSPSNRPSNMIVCRPHLPPEQSNAMMLRPLPHTAGRAGKLIRTVPSGAAAMRAGRRCATAGAATNVRTSTTRRLIG